MEVNNNKIVRISKYLFHISNILLICFYLFPGSIFGCFIYNDCKTQPQLTSDFLVSSNHVYAFIFLSLLAFISYSKSAFIRIITYLFFISIFLELAHLTIPERGFEIKDLAGNIVGVAISLIIFLIFKLRKKNEF
jgi:VanZ family protein